MPVVPTQSMPLEATLFLRLCHLKMHESELIIPYNTIFWQDDHSFANHFGVHSIHQTTRLRPIAILRPKLEAGNQF